MVQSLSWEANWFAASQEIPCISRNPKVHYRTHKRPQPVSILGQPNPVLITTSHLLDIQPNTRYLIQYLIHLISTPPNKTMHYAAQYISYEESTKCSSVYSQSITNKMQRSTIYLFL